MMLHPEIKQQRETLEKFTVDYTANYFLRQHQSQIQSDTILYIIPVVFHIMHDYGAENISKAQALDVMRIMNEYFQKTNADTAQIVPLFQPIIGDAQIEFRLAQLDPNGNCTDGITRHQTHLTNGGNDLLKSIVQWPPDKYLNIWVENESQNGFSAYAYLPGAPASIDGIVIVHNYVGSVGSAFGNAAFSTLAHETGHYLNLLHTWGPTNTPNIATNCSFDDLVFDTPNCIGGVCGLYSPGCNGDTANVQNMMDYCTEQMFTQGQVARMHAALNSTISNRNNLWAPANLLLTGTTDSFPATLCAPVADLTNKLFRICEGDSITFNNSSYGGNYTSVNWQFTGGNISTSADTNPTVQYNVTGFFDVTLTVTNSAGSSSIIRNGLVEVMPVQATTFAPAVQDFETLVFPSGNWNYENNGGTHWQTTTLAAASGTTSLYLQNDSANISAEDIFYTENYNLSNVTAPVFNFKVAFANRNTSNDNLKIFMSTDCGQTWVMKYTKSGNSLETVNDTAQNFIPTQTQWRQDGMNISMAAGENNVRIKFQFTCDGGNNIFIDDINISGVTGVNRLSANGDLIYVYPAVATTSITIKLKTIAKNVVFLKDMLGRELKKLNMPSEKQLVNIENIEPGVYFVEGISENKKFTAKFIKASNE